MKKLLINLLLFSALGIAQVQLGPFSGSVTSSSAQFIVKTFGSQKVLIELFAENDVENSIFSIEQITDTTFGYAKIPIFNLKPNTTYYYRAIVDGIASKRWHQLRTFPAEKRTSFSFGFGSCQQSSWRKWEPEIFPLIAQDSLRFFIQIGDWTYPDTTEKNYGYRYNARWDLLEKSYQSKYSYNYPFASEVMSQMPVAYVYDDHDFAANNPDGTDPNKEKTIAAYKEFFPHYPLANKDAGIWQKFSFGDAEFFIIDTRSQRSPNKNALDENGNINPPKGHSLLAGFEVTGENQKEWLKKSLQNSKAQWKVIVSSVLFNPGYALVLEKDSLMKKYPWMKDDVIDKWAGYPEEQQEIINYIKENDIKNVIVLSGDSHSSYIDDGTNSVLPEISASNLDVSNSDLHGKMMEAGLNVWNRGSYQGNGHTYGKVSFIYGEEDYALLEIIDENGGSVVSYKLIAE